MSTARKQKSRNSGKNTFYEDIKDKDRMLVLFYATWCPFSQEFLPVFQEYSRNNPQECMSIIVDEQPDICEEYSIEYYPTVIMFEKGKVQKRLDPEPGIGLNKKQLKSLTERQ